MIRKRSIVWLCNVACEEEMKQGSKRYKDIDKCFVECIKEELEILREKLEEAE